MGVATPGCEADGGPLIIETPSHPPPPSAKMGSSVNRSSRQRPNNKKKARAVHRRGQALSRTADTRARGARAELAEAVKLRLKSRWDHEMLCMGCSSVMMAHGLDFEHRTNQAANMARSVKKGRRNPRTSEQLEAIASEIGIDVGMSKSMRKN